MLFMEEGIYMSQEERIIKVYLEKKEKEDFLIFDVDAKMSICLNNEDSQVELQKVFIVLLQEILKHPIKLQYEKNNDYTNALYVDVCEEYVKDLNREILRIIRNVPERLKNIEGNI